jgi:hypothetical protein
MIVDGAPLEDCDAVAGDVPKQYADAFPSVDDYAAVKDRMASRDPNNQQMFGRREPPKYEHLSPEQQAARNANDISRGARPLAANERNELPAAPAERVSQVGTPRVPGGGSDSGWSTAPVEQYSASGDQSQSSPNPDEEKRIAEAAAKAREHGGATA